jgi:hypothetical protein
MTVHLPIIHNSCRVFWAKLCIIQVRHPPPPPHSPDLAPCDFWLFPKLKLLLKERIFQTVDEIKENATWQLMAISKEDFADCFEKWKRHQYKCVISQGEYFEED